MKGKDFCGRNISELTDVEISRLGDFGLNSCDKCGVIDVSSDLYWPEYYYGYNGQDIPVKMEGFAALCEKCHEELLK